MVGNKTSWIALTKREYELDGPNCSSALIVELTNCFEISDISEIFKLNTKKIYQLQRKE